MDAPVLRTREELITVRLGAEKGADFIEDTAETCGGGERFEAACGPIALFNALVVLL